MHKYAYMALDRNFSYFCDKWRKREFPAPSPCARDAERHIKRTRAAAADTDREMQ